MLVHIGRKVWYQNIFIDSQAGVDHPLIIANSSPAPKHFFALFGGQNDNIRCEADRTDRKGKGYLKFFSTCPHGRKNWFGQLAAGEQRPDAGLGGRRPQRGNLGRVAKRMICI